MKNRYSVEINKRAKTIEPWWSNGGRELWASVSGLDAPDQEDTSKNIVEIVDYREKKDLIKRASAILGWRKSLIKVRTGADKWAPLIYSLIAFSELAHKRQ